MGDNLSLVAALAIIGLWVAGIIGWFMNVFALIGSIGNPVELLTVLRIIGVFIPPFGGIMGYV